MKKYNISANIIWVIKKVYDMATSAVLFNGSIGDWFWTTKSNRDVFSHPPSSIDFWKGSWQDALEDHEGTVSIWGRAIIKLRFAGDINGLAGDEEELAKLAERLDKASTAYGMEISAEKTKLMTNNTSGINTEIKINLQKLIDCHKLQVPGLNCNWWGFQAWNTLQDSTDNSSIDKVETTLEWQEYFSQFQDTTDVLPCHIHLPVCLWIMDSHSRAPKKNIGHGNEVLPQDTTNLIQKDHVTNEEVCAKFQQAIRPHEDQVWPKPSCKAQWKGKEDKEDRGRGGKTTSGNGQAWSSPSPRGQWRTGKNGGNWLRNHLWCPNDPGG